MRVVYLTLPFRRTRAVYAPEGSPAGEALGRALVQLADERIPAPGANDEEALRTPIEVIWARRVPGADLVIMFSVLPLMLELRAVRPAW